MKDLYLKKVYVTSICQSQPTRVSIRRDSKLEIARTLGMGKVKE